MEKSVTVKARGKINLSLNIAGVQNNMHVLDSVTASVEIFDTVAVSFGFAGESRVRFVPTSGGPTAEGTAAIGAENSVTKALALLRSHCGDVRADVTVHKGIPLAGGLGGSSADAAAVLYAASALYPDLFPAERILRESVRVGSDVPMLLSGGGVRLRGTGEDVQAVSIPCLYLAIAHGVGGVNTAEAYKTFDAMFPMRAHCPADTEAMLRAFADGNVLAASREWQNALQAPAVVLSDAVRDTLQALRACMAAAVFMTGSGNCCCGWFDSAQAAENAARVLRSQGLWATATHTSAVGCEILP